MRRDLIGTISRGIRKPPRYIAQRIVDEVRSKAERHLAPLRESRLSVADLARQAGHRSSAAWWDALAARPFAAETNVNSTDLDRISPGDRARVFAGARRALAHQVDLLGSGLVELGSEVDWHLDYKSGYRWAPGYCRDIEYGTPDRTSDVKFPWELSRMQWMIPLGQAYLLGRDEAYAAAARDLLERWICSNRYAFSVNWSCTMDVALRVLSWSWLFHAFKESAAWADAPFKEQFLRALYLHGDFIARNLERSDINGNHYTADAAGLVFAGLFFGDGDAPKRWLNDGWAILRQELPRQVHPDGVDFEASVPYHRLVAELFLLPAIYRRRLGMDVPPFYVDRLVAMGRFTSAYSRSDGTVPLWGDADDARALPFGGQDTNDHRYLLALIGTEFDAQDLIESFSGPRSEIFWLLGPQAACSLPARDVLDRPQASAVFVEGGFYVLRNKEDHIFVDCGPLGLAGRGGHGHNDLLSFEAVLDGVHLVSDCGAYLYTADYSERNRFRSTAYHNTPQIDGEEINRFVRWDHLWALHNDAKHEVRELSLGPDCDTLIATHGGYCRLVPSVTPVRTFRLDHAAHRLTVRDNFEGSGWHAVNVPLHLARHVEIEDQQPGRIILRHGRRRFLVTWQSKDAWQLRAEPGRISPTYGVTTANTVLHWHREGPLAPLSVVLEPMAVQAQPRNEV